MAKRTEIRSSPLGLRIRPSAKKALEKAAADDHRTVASFVEKVITEWLQERGYLKRSQS
jgi:hypothetical protein